MMEYNLASQLRSEAKLHYDKSQFYYKIGERCHISKMPYFKEKSVMQKHSRTVNALKIVYYKDFPFLFSLLKPKERAAIYLIVFFFNLSPSTCVKS